MKKAVLTISAMLVGVTASVFGQMNDRVPGAQRQPSGSTMVAQQKDASDQKMNPEIKQNITALMKQVNETMQKMTVSFENKESKEGRAVLGRMMREMSLQMGEMAAAIEKGKLEPQTLTKMQARMESVNQRVDAIQ